MSEILNGNLVVPGLVIPLRTFSPVPTTNSQLSITRQAANESIAAQGRVDKSSIVVNVNASLREEINNTLSKQVTLGLIQGDNPMGKAVDLGGPVMSDKTSFFTQKSGPNASFATRDFGLPISSLQNTPAEPLPTSINTPPRDKVFEYKSPNGFSDQACISGSDLSIFYMVEVPSIKDIDNGLPLEACRKEIVILEFDSVLSISYSTIMEKFPVRSLGSTNARGITSGIRTISGHIAFNIFAEDILARLRGRVGMELDKRSKEEKPRTEYVSKLTDLENTESLYQMTPLANSGGRSMLLDQLPPFHLLVMGVTERGVFSRMMIKDVSIIDENQYQGTQQPNVMNRVSFVARDIVPMTAQEYNSAFMISSLTSMEAGYVGGNWQSNGMADMSASNILSIEADSINRSTNRGM